MNFLKKLFGVTTSPKLLTASSNLEIHNLTAAGDVGKVNAMLKINHEMLYTKGDQGRTILHLAAFNGRLNLVQVVLAHRVLDNKIKEAKYVNAKADDGDTPLHMAALSGSKDAAELLLGKAAEVDAKNDEGETPLHYAAGEGHKDVAELLLANRADVNAKDKKGLTPIVLATFRKHSDVAELLRQHGGHE